MGSSSSSSASAFGGSAGGWVKERFLRQRRYIADLTVNTESGDTIAVDVQMRTYAEDSTNEYVDADETVDFLVELREAAADNLPSAAAFTLAETGDGSEISTTGRTVAIMRSSSAGAAQVTVTDVATGSGVKLYVLIQPLNVPGYPSYTSVTFD